MAVINRSERLQGTLVYLMLILAGDVELNPGPTLNDRPTLRQLIGLCKAGETKPHVRVKKEIAACANYQDLAEILLDDSVSVTIIKKGCPDSDQFVNEMFRKWLELNDDDPNTPAVARTWGSLADSIELADLPGALAKSIRDVCSTYEKIDLVDIDPDVAKASMGVTVEIEITNVGTQGYAGVGKTSVLDLAMGNDPAPQRNSTDCIVPPSRYLMTDSATEGAEWEHATTDKMSELLFKAMKKTIEENAIGAATNQSTSDTQLLPLANDSITAPLDEPVFLDLLKRLSNTEKSGVIFNSHWMMVTDSGGQPPFLDASALFFRNSCLQIFPVKLNEPLNKTTDLTFFFKDKRAPLDEDCVPLTHKQIIETLAKSVASIQPPNTPSATECPKGAKFTIVGTFEDKAYECSETVEEKESILKQVLQPYEQFRVQLGKKVILPVNAALGKKADDTEVVDAVAMEKRAKLTTKLRKLFRKSNVSLKVKMNLRWFGLLLNILTIAEKEQKAVLTLGQCYKLGNDLGMGPSETKQAIRFFRDISLIMYFDTPKLRDSVIIDTKLVLNMLSRLISVSFLREEFLADHYDIELPLGAKELLQYHGRFSRETLEKCVKFNEHITSPFFLDILEHVKIAVAIDEKYFMPCALSYAPEPSVPGSSPAWVIRLRRKNDDADIPILVGYLPALIVFLLTESLSHFSTDPIKPYDPDQRQYRNMIKLRYKRGGHVFLIERHLQLEIHFSWFEELEEDCKIIRKHVLKSIELTEKKLHIIQEGEGAITKVDSFLCFCGEGSAHHTCAYNPLSKILECEKGKTGESCKLDPRHISWLDSSFTPHYTKSQHLLAADSHSVPAADSDTILRKLQKHNFLDHKWDELATGLSLSSCVPGIASENKSNHLKLIALVMHWTASVDESGRWKTLVDAVNDCGLYIVAKNLAKDVCVPCPPCPDSVL